MRDNVQIFLPLILYGIAVVIGLCLCYFVAPRNKRNRWIDSQRAHRWVHRILHLHPVSRDILRGTAEQFQLWVKEQADKSNAPIVEPPRGRRDEFVDPYFRGAGPDQVIVILKAREPAGS